MSAQLATASPRRIKASHRRRRRIASGQSVQRYYDPTIGRFLSVDPITANANTGAMFNRYWYGNANPYALVDPDGRQPVGSDEKPHRPELPDNIPRPPKGCGSTRDCFYYGEKWHFYPTPSGRESSIGFINDGPLEPVCPDCYLIGGWEIASYKSIIALRGAYVSGAEGLAAWGAELKAAGWTSEQAARLLVPLRNALKDELRRRGPITARMAAELDNKMRYGNRFGPSVEHLLEKNNGNWDKVLKGVGNTRDWLNDLLGI